MFKKKLILSLSAVFFSLAVFSQGPNCNSAAAFCSGSTSYPAGVGAGTAQAGPNYGCLFSQPNPAWFFMQVSTPGNIALTITASPPRDIDFILYGPFTSPTAPCVAQLTAANTEDCSYAGGTAPEVADITGGLAGEYYLMLLTNFSNQPTTISFAQTGGSGSTSCAVLCNISAVTATPTACVPATNTYSVSGQVTFTTPPTTGVLTVTSSCGGSQTFNPPFVSPISYNLGGINSNGAACNVTAVFSATPSCTRTQPYTSPPNCTPCIATANNNGPVCSGANLNLTAGTVAGATSYSWAGPSGFSSTLQNPIIGGVPLSYAGTYTVTVTTPSATCTATTTVVVNATPTAPAVSNNGPVCAGTSLNFTGPAIAGATYNWTGPGGFTSNLQNPSINPVSPPASGTYSLTVTVSGCTGPAGTTSAVVNSTPAAPIPQINASTTPAAICAGGTITLTANNIAGASYLWTGPNGYTAAVRNPPALTGATPVMGGTYSLTVTVGGCPSPASTVSITVNPIPAAPTVAPDSICSGSTATLTATAPGGTYDWYDASTAGTLLYTGASYTTPVLTASTTYYVQSTMSGCVGPRNSVTVTVSPSFSVSTIADDSICSGTSITLGITAPTTGTYTYSWSDPANPGFATTASPTVTPAATTTYTVTLTDAIGCTGSDVITISVGTPLTLTATGSPANCYNSCNGQGTAVVGGSFPPYTYAWSNSATTATVTGLCANTYTVVITDVIGCTIQDTIHVQQPTPLIIMTSVVTAHCNQPDGSATVIASGGVSPYSYSWTPTSQTTATADTLIPGNYIVTVTDWHSCTATATAVVPNAPGVLASVTASTLVTCNAACDGTATVTATSGIPPYTYLWSNSQTAATATGLCAGSYTCTVTDSVGCSDTALVTILQPAAIMISALTPSTICIGQSATLTASATGGNAGGYTFGWTAPTFVGNPNIVSPTTTTTYTVGATDSQGCVSANTQTVTVTVRQPLAITASNDESICPGSSAALSAVATGGNSASYSYSWMPGSGSGSAFTVSPSTTTTYTVTLTDACTSVAATDVVTVTILSLPNPNFTSDVSSGCAPLCVAFKDLSTVSAGGTIAAWNWSIDGQTYTNQDTTHCFNNAGQYSITLTTTSNSGCVNTLTIPNMITVYAMPTAAFTYDPNPISINYPNVSFNDHSTNANGWFWDFGDGILNPTDNFSTIPNPVHSYTDVGTYCVQLIVMNTPACVDTSDQVCLVIEPDFTFYIPNSFTPDGSGLNEEFYARGENIAEFDMMIYDRWGNLVFHSNDINKHWNGTMKGTGTEYVPMDVYVYIINLTDKIGEKHQYIGHVTVIK